MNELHATIAELIAAVTQGRVAAAELNPDTPLVPGGVALESIELLELVVLVEERLGVELRADELVTGHIATLGRLTALIAARRAP